MANLSSAHGKIIIDYHLFCDGTYPVKTFLKLLSMTTGYVQYDTAIDLADSLFLLDEAIKEEWDLTIEFEGTGRWTYEHNVKVLFDMLGWIAEDYCLQAEYQTMINQFLKTEIPIEFKFVDIEEGLEVYYGEIMEALPYRSKGHIETMTKIRGKEWEK